MSDRSLPLMVPQGEAAQFSWQYDRDTPEVVPTPCSNTLYITVPFTELNCFLERELELTLACQVLQYIWQSFSLAYECDDHEEWQQHFCACPAYFDGTV